MSLTFIYALNNSSTVNVLDAMERTYHSNVASQAGRYEVLNLKMENFQEILEPLGQKALQAIGIKLSGEFSDNEFNNLINLASRCEIVVCAHFVNCPTLTPEQLCRFVNAIKNKTVLRVEKSPEDSPSSQNERPMLPRPRINENLMNGSNPGTRYNCDGVVRLKWSMYSHTDTPRCKLDFTNL